MNNEKEKLNELEDIIQKQKNKISEQINCEKEKKKILEETEEENKNLKTENAKLKEMYAAKLLKSKRQNSKKLSHNMLYKIIKKMNKRKCSQDDKDLKKLCLSEEEKNSI